MSEHKRENCPFYPACFVMGDCNEDDWKTHDCGLPEEEKQAKRHEFLTGLHLQVARNDLGKKLKQQAHRGELDHMLDKDHPHD